MSGPWTELAGPLPPVDLPVGAVKHPRVCDACEHGRHEMCTPCPVCSAPCLCPHGSDGS